MSLENDMTPTDTPPPSIPFAPLDSLAPDGRLHERLEFWVQIPNCGVCRVTYKLEKINSEFTVPREAYPIPAPR